MKAKILLIITLLMSVSVTTYASWGSRRFKKINNALEAEALSTTRQLHGKQLDAVSIFDECQYDKDTREMTYYYTIVEDIADISSYDTIALKQVLRANLISNRGIVEALSAVAGSLKYIYTGDTSGQKILIEFTYMELNNLPYF